MFLSIKHQPETEAERQGRGLQNTIPPPTRFISSSLILHLIRLFSIFTQNYQVITKHKMKLNKIEIRNYKNHKKHFLSISQQHSGLPKSAVDHAALINTTGASGPYIYRVFC